MASPTSQSHGSQTATIGTEHTLSGGTFSTQGSWVMGVDMKNLALGDLVELRIYTILDASDNNTSQIAYFASFSDVQACLNTYSVPVAVDGTVTTQIKFTLKQTVGTGRAFYFNLMTL